MDANETEAVLIGEGTENETVILPLVVDMATELSL